MQIVMPTIIPAKNVFISNGIFIISIEFKIKIITKMKSLKISFGIGLCIIMTPNLKLLNYIKCIKIFLIIY